MKKYNGEYHIPASREKVWQFLTDPHKVGYCLPDVLELDIADESNFRAVVRIGIGPIRGKFTLTNSLTIEEPGYSATMTVKGGGMGSGVNMSAKMILEEQETEGVLLKWSSDVIVSGPIATIGGRLIDGQAKKVTEQVFDNIAKEVIKLAEEETNLENSQIEDKIAVTESSVEIEEEASPEAENLPTEKEKISAGKGDQE